MDSVILNPIIKRRYPLVGAQQLTTRFHLLFHPKTGLAPDETGRNGEFGYWLRSGAGRKSIKGMLWLLVSKE